MSKEKMLEKAYIQASTNDAVRYADKDIDFSVIKMAMTEYAKKNNIEISTDEIEKYITSQLAKVEQGTKDFSYQSKMMN